MAGEYHGWDEVGEIWKFAEVSGEKTDAETFVITDFGGCSSRQALSSIMCATQQFGIGHVHLRRTDSTKRLIDKLVEAQLVRTAPMTGTEHEEVGVLGVRTKPPRRKQTWWKFWQKS